MRQDRWFIGRSHVYDVCSEHARTADWAEFVPAMRNKVMLFEVVDEEEWQHRLNAMLTA